MVEVEFEGQTITYNEMEERWECGEYKSRELTWVKAKLKSKAAHDVPYTDLTVYVYDESISYSYVTTFRINEQLWMTDAKGLYKVSANDFLISNTAENIDLITKLSNELEKAAFKAEKAQKERDRLKEAVFKFLRGTDIRTVPEKFNV